MPSTKQSSAKDKLPRIALVGCGAAAREFCLPVLVKYPDFQRAVVVVDTDMGQARTMARKYGFRHCSADYRDLPLDIDAAIITTPHSLHARQSTHFLRQGKPVFVEKPLGMSSAEVAEMLAAAATGGVPLMVNNCRRLFPSYQAVRELLRDASATGAARRVEIADGSPFAWQSVSAFYVRKTSSSRGVFLDRGAHTIDMLCWWLGARPRVVRASSDAAGGAEAVMDVELACGDAEIQVKFSRLQKLKNSYDIQCDRARISGRLFDPSRLEIDRGGQRKTIKAGPAAAYQVFARKLVDNFVQVVLGRASPLVAAQDVAPSISVIEEAYERAQPLEAPWYAADRNIALLKQHAAAGQA